MRRIIIRKRGMIEGKKKNKNKCNQNGGSKEEFRRGVQERSEVKSTNITIVAFELNGFAGIGRRRHWWWWNRDEWWDEEIMKGRVVVEVDQRAWLETTFFLWLISTEQLAFILCVIYGNVLALYIKCNENENENENASYLALYKTLSHVEYTCWHINTLLNMSEWINYNHQITLIKTPPLPLTPILFTNFNLRLNL